MKEIMTDGDLWTALGGISMLGLAVSFWIPLLKRRVPHKRWRYLFLVGVLCGAAGMIAFAPHPMNAVVRQGDTSLLLSPFEKAEPTSRLEAGDTVRVVKHHGDYAYVQTQRGGQGWVSTEKLERYTQLFQAGG